MADLPRMACILARKTEQCVKSYSCNNGNNHGGVATAAAIAAATHVTVAMTAILHVAATAKIITEKKTTGRTAN